MKRFLILFFLSSAFCLFMLSCASNWTKNYGSSVQDADIKAMFETYEYVSKNYNYFYTGYGNDPQAIVGIKKDYELVKVSGRVNVTNWQQFEPDSKKLKEKVEAMHNPSTYGYIIYGPGGNQVGVMYTARWESSYTEIRLKDGNQLEVTPHNDNSNWAPS
jgi:hypothetical protein